MAVPPKAAPPATSEAALAEALVDATPLAIYAKDAGRRFVLSNRQHAAFLERPAGDVLGRTDQELFGDEAGPVEALTAEVLRSGVSASQEFSLTLPDGTVHTFLETIFPVRDEHGTVLGVGGMATDISLRRRLEVELRARNAELEETVANLRQAQAALIEQQKLAALGEMVAGLAHEVNTPLGVALMGTSMAAEILQREGTLRPDQRAMAAEGVALAQASIQRASALVQSIRQTAGDRHHHDQRTVQLSEWVAELRQTLLLLTGQQGVRLQISCPVDGRLRLGAGALHQVLSNLVSNAVFHAFDEESVDPLVSVGFLLERGGLAVTVSDNGRGVPAEHRHKLFEPFFTTRRGQGGTGLGLHVARSLVVGQFGGTLSLVDQPGPGATFSLWLPMGAGALAPGDAAR